MPFLPTAQEWLTQSALLLQARPDSIRITTKYSLPKTTKESKANSSKPAPSTSDSAATATTSAKPPPTATLTLKTYDPASGVTLKYQTNKVAEVGRLVQIMGRLGRGMAGLEMEVNESVVEKAEVEESAPPATSATAGGKAAAPVQSSGMPGQGGGKGKKKKGKK